MGRPRLEIIQSAVYGRLTVLSEAPPKNGQLFSTVQCACGTIKDVYNSSLFYGRVTSCGCVPNSNSTRKDPPVNTRFGRLVVLGPSPSFVGRRSGSIVQCDCGVVKAVRNSFLNSGKTTSCGCFQKEGTAIRNTNRSPAKTREEQLYRVLYSNLLSRHKRKAWDGPIISPERHKYLLQQPCVFCGFSGSRLITDTAGQKLVSNTTISVNGVDRRDSTIGYTVENSFSACTYCNQAKSDKPEGFFLHWVAEVYHKSVKNTHNDLQDII